MKQLTCEMCGSTDLMKQNGVFVCQTCGMKYSVEEAKKMVIEGTVNVKIDESEKFNNYLALAKSADEANNYNDLESYCGQALVIDPKNYEVWFLRGKAILGLNLYDDNKEYTCSDAVVCFKNSTFYAPADKKSEINYQINQELYPFFVMRADFIGRCFTDNPSEFESTYIYFMEQMQKNALGFREFITKDDDLAFYNDDVASTINSYVHSAWEKATSIFNYEKYPDDDDWTLFKDAAFSCMKTINCSINCIPTTSTDLKIQRYLALIEITERVINSCGYVYNGNFYLPNMALSNEARVGLTNRIMEYHQKIKEIDPYYFIPNRQNPKNLKGGCYIATCVYGSYDCPEVWTLRRYRDNTLKATWYGRLFIRTYYAISPTLVKWFGNTNWFKKLWKRKLDRMVTKLQKKGVENTPYKDR